MSTLAKKIAFHTLGCKLNFSETSTLSRDSIRYGYENVNYKEFADISLNEWISQKQEERGNEEKRNTSQ